MTNEERRQVHSVRPRTALAIGWSRGIGVLSLALTAGFVSPAQDGQPSPSAVTFVKVLDFGATGYVFPSGPVVQGTDGNLYGTTSQGGAGFSGAVYRVATSGGSFTPLYTFCAQPNCLDGAGPNHVLVSTDGNLYGTTLGGGANGAGPGFNGADGTAFKLSLSGTLTKLYDFCALANCTDGDEPNGFILATDGNFYGTSPFHGGTSTACYFGCGNVFKMTPQGAMTMIYSFCSLANCADGEYPSPLIQATDGNFYGTTGGGGSNNGGTVFKISRTGALKTLYNFCAQANCGDGSNPSGGLVQAANGKFYGTTSAGGANGKGTVFEISASGALNTLYSFCAQTNCGDGSQPAAPLTQATDQNFYGVTAYGGANGDGTVFSITASGALNTLHSFGGGDGLHPGFGLLQATNGKLYGISGGGGTTGKCGGGCGTLFSLSVGLGPFVSLLPTSGKVADTIQILGTNLTGATSVTFNGTAAAFTVVSATLISATVPAGATSGFVTVTTPTGTLKSNTKFRVK